MILMTPEKDKTQTKNQKYLIRFYGFQGMWFWLYFIKDKNIVKSDLGTITLDYCSKVRLNNILIFYEIEPRLLSTIQNHMHGANFTLDLWYKNWPIQFKTTSYESF